MSRWLRVDQLLTAWVLTRIDAAREESDRGDLPGWVMVTVMTAALVVFLLSVAKTPLQNAFETAIQKVTGAS